MNTTNVVPLSRRADVSTVDDKTRTVELVWTTGAKVLRSNWSIGPFYEELSMDPKHVRMGRLASGSAPFLADHNGDRVAATLGVVETARIEKGRGVARVRFAAEGIDPEADKVFAKIRDKIVRNVSVGYRTYKAEKTESADGTAPTLRAVDWEPYEISAVAMGADADAGFRNETQVNPCVITTHPTGSRKMETQNEEPNGGVDELTKRERERVMAISHACRTAKLGDDFAQRMVAGGVPLDEARKQVLEELARRDAALPTSNLRVEVGAGAEDKYSRAMVSALLCRADSSLVRRAKAAGVQGFQDVDTDIREFRDMSLMDMAKDSLERSGTRTRLKTRDAILNMALTTRQNASDFPVLFENAMHKLLLASYALQPATWRQWCGIDTVKDFRESNRYRTSALTGELPVVPENAEYTYASIPDGTKIQIETETRGELLSLSRQQLINDDMGAFVSLIQKHGSKASRAIELAAFKLLSANGGLGPILGDEETFFHSSRGNIGVDSVLGADSLEADRVQLTSQKEGDDFLEFRPHVLLLAAGLGGLARQLVFPRKDDDMSIVAGVVKEVVDTPRLLGARRYMFCDPLIAPAFKVVFLNDVQEPVLERKEGFERDGIAMKVRFDFKVNAFDPKGVITNRGVVTP